MPNKCINLDKVLGLKSKIAKEEWKHPEMSGAELVRHYREKENV